MKAGDWITLAAVLLTGGGGIWHAAVIIARLEADVRELQSDLRAALAWLGDLERRVGGRRR